MATSLRSLQRDMCGVVMHGELYRHEGHIVAGEEVHLLREQWGGGQALRDAGGWLQVLKRKGPRQEPCELRVMVEKSGPMDSCI